MKKKFSSILFISLSLLCANAFADVTIPGLYFGIQAGPSYTHYIGSDLFPGVVQADSSGSKGYAGRIYSGYQFYQTNFALELGYTYFQPIKATGGINGITPSGTVVQQALDIAGKETLPLGNNFNLYGKLGAAYLMANSKLHLACTEQATCDQIKNLKDPTLYNDAVQQRLYPTASIGVSYDITQRVPIDLSWTRIQKVGGGDLKSTDMLALGIAYDLGE